MFCEIKYHLLIWSVTIPIIPFATGDSVNFPLDVKNNEEGLLH